MQRMTSLQDRVLTCLALHLLWVVSVSSVEVKVDYTGHDQQGDAMPDDVNVTVSTGNNTTAILRLSRVPHINLVFPLYTLNHDVTGTFVRRREKRATKKMTAFYQNMDTDAVFQITRNENHKNMTDLFKVKGEFRMPGKSFFLKSEKRRKRHFKSTATSTTQKSTSTDSASRFQTTMTRFTVQKVQRLTSDVFTEAHQDSQDQDTKNETPSTIKPETEQMIDLSTEQSSIHSDSKGSTDKPDLFAKLRRRRRSTTTCSVDVAAVVDCTLYLKFLTATGNDRTAALQNIREYFAFIFNGMDQRFQNLDTNYIIHVYLSQVFIAESSSTSPLAGTDHPASYILSQTALSAFKNFVAQRAKDMLTSYDHAILFTAYDLAYEKDYRTVDVDSIVWRRLIDNFDNYCDAPGAKLFIIFKIPWADLLRGDGNLMIEKQNNGVQKIGSDLCHALYCLNTRDNLCYTKVALDGTTCGNLKICRSGQCVSDPQAPTVEESCMFGDTPGIIFEGMTCPQLIQTFSRLCYVPGAQQVCCTSCREAYRTVKDDVCRNRELSCYFLKDDALTQCYDEVFNRKCCQFCQQHQTKITGCEYGDRTPELCKDKSMCHSNANVCCRLCTISSGNTIGYSCPLTILIVAAVVVFLQSL